MRTRRLTAAAMADREPLDGELAGLLAAASPNTAVGSVPALLIRRARDLREPLVGKRGRFLMTSHSTEGDWLAHGWKDGLRVVSEVVGDLSGLGDPAVWVQEERDYYGDTESTNRFAVGLSRVWVEQYVSAPRRGADSGVALGRESWIDNLNRDPNSPELRTLQPAEGHPDPVGARVVVDGDHLETDLRAVSPVRMTDNGESAITVIAERDWYRWARDYPAAPHPSLRWEPAGDVWVE